MFGCLVAVGVVICGVELVLGWFTLYCDYYLVVGVYSLLFCLLFCCGFGVGVCIVVGWFRVLDNVGGLVWCWIFCWLFVGFVYWFCCYWLVGWLYVGFGYRLFSVITCCLDLFGCLGSVFFSCFVVLVCVDYLFVCCLVFGFAWVFCCLLGFLFVIY